MNAYFKIEEDGKSIRYMAAGTTKPGYLDDEFVSGIVYGYTGGGCFEDIPVYEGKLIPMTEDDMGSDEYCDLLDEKTGNDLFSTNCWNELYRYAEYSDSPGCYILNEKGQKAFAEAGNGKYFFSRKEFIPQNFSMTGFSGEGEEDSYESLEAFYTAA